MIVQLPNYGVQKVFLQINRLQSTLLICHFCEASSYVSSSSDMPFLTYFAQTTPDSPHRQARLKTCLFLQGSTLYSPEKVMSLLQDASRHQGVDLAKEVGILGPKKDHRGQ